MKLRACALLLAAGLATGCTDNDASVLIDAACFPPAPEDGQCVVSDTCDLFLTGVPFVDLAATGDSFLLPLQLRNQLADNADESSSSTNTNIAFIDELQFTYRAPGFLLEEVRAPMTSFAIDPGGTAVAWMELIAPAAVVPDATTNLADLTAATRVTIEVSAIGHYNSGAWFETGSFQIVADMCRGCAATVSPCATGETFFACPQPGQTSSFECVAAATP